MELVIVSNLTELLLVAVYIRVFYEKTNLRERANIFLGETNYGVVCSKIVSRFERFLGGGGEADLGGGGEPQTFFALRARFCFARYSFLRDFLGGGGRS